MDVRTDVLRTKNEKSKDYSKADSEQLVLFFLPRTKISWMHRLPNFLTNGAPLRSRAPLKNISYSTSTKKKDSLGGWMVASTIYL